jgi:short-subunit dehydrogenase
MNTKDGAGKTALITGASAGIGTALARVFAEHGFDLVLTARREDRLAQVAAELQNSFGVRATVIAADLADAGAPQRLFDETRTRGIAVDALVNNAGYGVPGSFRKTPWSTHADFMQVLVLAVLQLTHLFEPGMKERGYGRIMNVASLAGLVPGAAGQTLYGAAKSFLIKFSESLSLEHTGDGVLVSALCPGFTYSEFHDIAGVRGLVSKLPRYMWMDAETVARTGYRALMAGQAVCVPGKVNQTIASVTRLVPESLALGIMKRQSKRIRRE